MSKPKKVYSKKLVDVRTMNHYASCAIMNPHQASNNYSQVMDKSDIINESPYAQKLSKIRSTSIIKDPSLYQPSGILSPPLNPKFAMNLKSKINLGSSFISKSKEPGEPSKPKKKPIVISRKSMDNDPYVIELKLDEIFSKHKETGISIEILEMYKECFEEIIYKDKTFGPLLMKIKSAYEDFVKSKTQVPWEYEKLRMDVVEFSKKLTEEIEENKRLHKKIQKFSKENVELGRALEEKETGFRALQEYLLKVTNINVEDLPQDKATWKVMVAENRNYSDLCGKLKKKIKSMKKQEKKLMALFWVLKQKGYPVEEMYDNLNKKHAKHNSTISIDVSDEQFETEPAKPKQRPNNVPILNMNKVEPNSFSDEKNSDSDSENSY